MCLLKVISPGAEEGACAIGNAAALQTRPTARNNAVRVNTHLPSPINLPQMGPQELESLAKDAPGLGSVQEDIRGVRRVRVIDQ